MKNKTSLFFNKTLENFSSEKSKGGRRRLYNSLWAFFFGVIVSIIIISATGNNPFDVLFAIFKDAIRQDIKFITTTVVFIIATLGTAMCFKSGIFNIGVSGQMMAGGMTTIFILKLIGINEGTIFLSIILAILSGALVAAVAGTLKAFFKVNEVVSTILLNWIIFYIIKFFIQSNIPGLVDSISIGQNQTAPFIMPNFFYSGGWLALLSIMGVTFIFAIWFLFSKTSIGYKMKMLQMNKEASKYAGSNEKLLLISIMTISGAFSGFAGFLYYIEIGSIRAASEPITMGFDTIAIALLVYNNPFGIGMSSVLFTIIKLGCGTLQALYPPLTDDFAQIMFGIIIYMAAICVVFEKLNLYKWISNNYKYCKSPGYKEILKKYYFNKKNIYYENKKNIKEIKAIKSKNQKTWKEIKRKSIEQKESLDKKLFTNKIKLINLNEQQQQDYFFQINLIKKEKNNNLFETDYFEISKIKNIAKILKIKNKQELVEAQKEILKKYKEIKNNNKKINKKVKES